MQEIARIIKLVLSNTHASRAANGKSSLAKYDLDETIQTQARERVRDLLTRYPLYPELDAALLATY